MADNRTAAPGSIDDEVEEPKYKPLRRVSFWHPAGSSIVESQRGKVAKEFGDSRPLKADCRDSKIAVVASYTATPQQSLSTSRYLQELSANGYRPLLVSTCPAREKLVFPHGLPADTVILRKPNVGYDFGSWAMALVCYPKIRRARHLLLTNDSMVGPFAPLTDLLARVEGTNADLTAMTDSYQIARHIQSYFVCYHNGILNDEPWRRFFNSIAPQPTKMDVVIKYEMALSLMCQEWGYAKAVMFKSDDLGVGYENPTLQGWFPLLKGGYPFVKRTIINTPELLENAKSLPKVVKALYGEDITAWV